MSKKRTGTIIENPWSKLRAFTPARIALGRAGTSLPTAPHLAFQLAHARARNAVHHELDEAALAAKLRSKGFEVLTLKSQAENRPQYLQRPDKGRRLDNASLAAVASEPRPDGAFDLAIVIGDGLSALAIEENALPFIDTLMPLIKKTKWRLAPLSIVKEARVAVGDEVGELLGAKIVVIMIGERPGLSSPDSMGIYMTHAPRVGMTDESRNCISNVRPEGLSYKEACHKLMYLLSEAEKRGISGVNLKDESETLPTAISGPHRNFLIDNG
jgi:ethanolamine ammonia-lyase small subunit